MLEMWTIFDHRHDEPGGFVARRRIIDGSPEGTLMPEALAAPDIEILRDHFANLGLVALTRDPSDPPAIVETWF